MPGPLDPKFIGQVPNGGTGRDFFPTGCFVAGNGKQKLQAVLAAKTGSVGMTSQDSMLQAAPALGVGDCWNLAVKYVNGRFSLTSSSFRALGKDAQGDYNIGFCRIPLSTGASEVFELRADQFFDDSTATDSDIIGEEFGTTAGVAWGNARPFYIYGCNVTDDPRNGFRCFISPNPTLTSSPALAANIGYQDVVAATPSDSNAFFLCPEDATIYTSKPCVLIGSFRMTKNASDDWALVTPTTKDGIGQFNVSTRFSAVTGQMGADAGSFLDAGADTVPTWATPANILYDYWVNLSGDVRISFSTANAGNCTNGSGVVQTSVRLPYAHAYNQNGVQFALAFMRNAGAITHFSGVMNSSSTTGMFLQTTAAAAITSNAFSNAADDIIFELTYKAFSN